MKTKSNGIELDTNNPIVAVVMPLREQAMERAEKEARKFVENVRAELKAANNDLEICAPYPQSSGPKALYGNDFRAAVTKYKVFRSLCESRPSQYRSLHDPNYADVNSNYVAKFVKAAREDAAFQYDAFICKLIKKIGTVLHAELKGNHVWGFSFLTVELPSGEKQIWKTQQIVNCSKLGKLFNQFPTRKVKEAK